MLAVVMVQVKELMAQAELVKPSLALAAADLEMVHLAVLVDLEQ